MPEILQENKLEFKEKRSLDEIMAKTGYEEVSTIEELKLSLEQTK